MFCSVVFCSVLFWSDLVWSGPAIPYYVLSESVLSSPRIPSTYLVQNGKFGVPFTKTVEAVQLIEHPQRRLDLGAARRERFMDQARKDMQFLARHHIIDYSLLLGVHR